MRRRLVLALWVCALALGVGFAAAKPFAFRQALPGYVYRFPQDHAAHPAYKTEWWYYTGHLQSQDGSKRWGFEQTIFRVGQDPTKLPKNATLPAQPILMTHLALTDETGQRFVYTERLNRPLKGLAGADATQYRVWNGTDSLHLQGGRHHLKAQFQDISWQLRLAESKPPVIHGINGVSQKADCVGCASHYYSLTRMKTDGALTIGQKRYVVQGLSWMDHEFGSNQLTATQTGWDWFSLQLDNQTELMLYLLRRKDGSIDPNSSGTWIPATGRPVHLKQSDFKVLAQKWWQSPKTGARYPAQWQVILPRQGWQLTVTPTVADQELAFSRNQQVSYWEGSCRVTARQKKRVVTGHGYVELTGYQAPFRQRL
jgi:predicted secreted hydrolase